MSARDNESIYDKMNPELFMPASTDDMNAIAREIDVILDNHNEFESIETQLMGEYQGINFGIRSELSFESRESNQRNYHSFFELNDVYGSDGNEATLKIGYDHKDKAYAYFNKLKINHDDTVNKLAYYASHLMKLVAFSDEEPELVNDKYFMQTAGAGHGIIQCILESDTIPAIETVHNYYEKHETANIDDFRHIDLAESIMSWLQKNELTRVKNSKALVINMEENIEFAIHSQRTIKNHRRENGLEISTGRSLGYVENKKEANIWKQDKSRELNLEHKNDQLDLNLTSVVTHNGETGFMDEIQEIIRSNNAGYGGLDNQIVKKPIVGDIAFFNEKLSEALKIIENNKQKN